MLPEGLKEIHAQNAKCNPGYMTKSHPCVLMIDYVLRIHVIYKIMGLYVVKVFPLMSDSLDTQPLCSLRGSTSV